MHRRILFLVMVVTMLLAACQDNKEEPESTLDIYDFSLIKHAPETKKKQDLDDAIKIYFIENDSALDTGFAIDLENNDVYIDPRVGSRGVRRTNDDPDALQDTQSFIDLLDAYDVQNWKNHYADRNNDEDGYGWKLIVQYADGSTETHSGSGTDMEEITPDNFHSFTQELAKIVENELDEKE